MHMSPPVVIIVILILLVWKIGFGVTGMNLLVRCQLFKVLSGAMLEARG
jgi:hypothetical protein